MKEKSGDRSNYLSVICETIRNRKPYPLAPENFRYKLDAMEMPYEFDSNLHKRWVEKLSACKLNRYPTGQSILKQKLVEHFDLPDTCDVMPGNGSDELLQILALSILNHQQGLLFLKPDFSMYPIIAQNCGLRYTEIPLRKDFSLDQEAFLSAIERHRPAMIWLSSPHNPTGKEWDSDDIDDIAAASSGLVLIDEAYEAFAQHRNLDKLQRHPNLLISRTFSKVGLAGLRFGVLLGRKELIAELDKLRLPYNINALTQMSIEFALQNQEFFRDKVDNILLERERLYRALEQIDGVFPIPSSANFILLRLSIPADKAYQHLCENNILVKYFAGQASLDQHIRVTIGLPAENNAFLSALQALLRA